MNLHRPYRPVERSGRMYSAATFPNLPLAHGVGPDRHLRAYCRCGAWAVIDPSRWIADKLGGAPLTSFYARLRCTQCGARSVPIEVWNGVGQDERPGVIWAWR